MDSPFTAPHRDLGKIAIYEGVDGRPCVGFIVEGIALDPRVRVVDIDDRTAYLKDGDRTHLAGRWHYDQHLTILGADVLGELSDLGELLSAETHRRPAGAPGGRP